jgi:hypothetical protein
MGEHKGQKGTAVAGTKGILTAVEIRPAARVFCDRDVINARLEIKN